MTQPHVCLLATCTRDCTTECREAINQAWTSLRGKPPAQPRHTADHITGDQLDQLYGWLTTARAVARAEQKRAERAEAALNAVRALHQRYRSPLTDDFDCCAHCNRIANDLAPYPCPTLAALDAHTTPTENR